MDEEGLQATKHDKIHIAEPMNINMDMIKEKLDKLNNLLETTNNEDKEIIKETIKEIVPTFKDKDVVNKERIEEVSKKEEIAINEEKLVAGAIA